jgi:hypothetical protein
MKYVDELLGMVLQVLLQASIYPKDGLDIPILYQIFGGTEVVWAGIVFCGFGELDLVCRLTL